MQTQSLSEEQAHQLAEVHRLLTPKEREYLQCFVNGLSGKEIGFELGVSPQTVSTHKAAVLRKLGCANKLEHIRQTHYII
jgi:DNA-binding NarL/FixJ family response regulator